MVRRTILMGGLPRSRGDYRSQLNEKFRQSFPEEIKLIRKRSNLIIFHTDYHERTKRARTDRDNVRAATRRKIALRFIDDPSLTSCHRRR